MSDDATSYRQIQWVADDDKRAAKMQQLRLRVLREMCGGFDERPDTFPQIVSWALEVLVDEPIHLAGHFGMCAATVKRWADGKSLPYESVQGLVVEEIREMAVERLEDRDEHDSDTD